ncbi:MAG: restriction endonuclease subunit S [Lautropia sp.]|nr:restriction endonuclease subunit S [Lautropia sp.]
MIHTENQESQLPYGWTWVSIGETGRYINGFAFKPNHRNSKGLPIVRIQNLTDESKPLNKTTLAVSEDHKIDSGDMLVSWSATLDVYVWNRGPALVNQHIFKVSPNENLISRKLLFHWLRQAIQELKDTEHLHGSTMLHINRAPFMAHRVPMPPFAEQTRIVEKLEELLSQLDAGAAELQAAQKKLEQYRQSLLKAAVEGQLTAGWRARNKPAESGKQLLERILRERRSRWEAAQLAKFEAQGKPPPKDWQKKYPEPVAPNTSNLPELPEGWVWASLDMIGEIASGVAKGTKSPKGIPTREVPYLRVANVQRGYLDLSEIKFIEATEKDINELTLQNGDVLFNEGGDRDKLGRGWVWRDEVPNCIHQNHVFRFRRASPDIEPELLSHHGNTFGKLWFQRAGKQTTNLASINMTMLKAFPVPLAPPSEQRAILENVQYVLDNINQQESSIKLATSILSTQRQNILRAAFAGELVPQDPNDEPAGELLARIQAERAAQAPQKTVRTRQKPAAEGKPRKPRMRKPKEDT